MPPSKPPFPDGHFYSPTIDPDDLRSRKHEIWPATPEVAGIDFNDAFHRRILEEEFPRYIADYDYPDDGPADESLERFYNNNSQFGWLDSRLLFVMLRSMPPRRIIEVGSGYSSLLMADVNRRFLGEAADITCIEPYPRPFLKRGVPGIARVIENKVQQVPLETFGSLVAGDVLFIDSSHVSKTGSDVNYLYFEVIPRLARGVLIHVHDIFLPHEYPQDWVLGEHRSWNEQYVLRALLMDSRSLEFLFGSYRAFSRFPDLVSKALGLADGRCYGGGSVWIRKL